MRERIAVALIPVGLIVAAFLIYLLFGWVAAVGWMLFILVFLVGSRLLTSEREERQREERELIERATAPAFHQFPDRCLEAPDPYREKEAA